MNLSRFQTKTGPRWVADDGGLPEGLTLGFLLELPFDEMLDVLRALPRESVELGKPLSPVEDDQEVWAAGVTYLRSRVEREAESAVADVYAKVYEAERPEIFFKSVGWRTVGHGECIRIRRDSKWNVPEPELTVVINRHRQIVGYTAGNDVSSRSIEGDNPLYLPQAKTYDGSCAVGPGIILCSDVDMANLPIHVSISAFGFEVFAGDANTGQMKRSLLDLASYLCRETTFPRGVFLMTGTGIVPGPEFTLAPMHRVSITVGEVTLENEVAAPFP
ncbi:MAG: fumarylacetoacetate hydrolase family protein [Fimbriimonas sp.]|nr:fumarylacetoacetate hydrolase family protein [Fimbriimonas sp.]